MVCGIRSAIGLAESGLAGISSLDARSVADSNLMLAVGACVAATGAAMLIARWTPLRVRAVGARGVEPGDERVATGDLHSALIDDLMRSARIAHREGLSALSHPLNRSEDADVQYAIDLVCSRADARIVRGVLIGKAQAMGREAPSTSRRRVWISIAGAAALTAVCGLWIAGWIADRAALSQASGVLFGAWCVACAVWCFGSIGGGRKGEAAASGAMATKHEIILAAAEGMARGEAPETIEEAIMGRAAVGRVGLELTEAA